MGKKIKCKQAGQIVGNGFTEMTGRVYDTDGLTPSIRTFSGGNTEVKILETDPLIWDGYNQSIRSDNSTCGTLTRNVGGDLKRNGIGVIEPIIIEDFYKNRETRTYDDCPTIRADRQGLKVLEPKNEPTATEPHIKDYRIRKLTEKECFRLMGVKNRDFEKVSAKQSMSSLYHLAGDSIVTTCLMAIFGTLLGVDYKNKIDEHVKELQNDTIS